MSKIIACGGQAVFGKDHLCDRLAKKLNEKEKIWLRTAFASNVKKIFCDAFNVDGEFIEKWKTKNECPPGFNMPIRESLQFIGNGFREIQDSVWIDMRFRNQSNQVISDVRYLNEAKKVKENNGLNILIGRPEKLNTMKCRSEAELKPLILYCLDNYDPNDKMVILNKNKKIEGLDLFDVFIRNDENLEIYNSIIDNQLLNYVNNYFKMI